MHPDTRERPLPRKMFPLRNLARVVRKSEVSASAVNIDLRTKIAHRHRAALYMPAGTAWAPGAGPCGFARSLRLPEHKIKGILFTWIVWKIAAFVGDSQHGMIIIQTNRSRHHGKIWISFDTEIDVARVLVGIPLCQ